MCIENLTCFSNHRIPGQLGDRRTMLGELNWIFTAITDTIAWNILPRGMIFIDFINLTPVNLIIHE